eukprot:g9974.t1
MGFIDENCAVFDTEEENKLSYTTLHQQFKELVETLCANSLAEVGVAVGDFVEALEASRLSQDISTAVYQQLVALDDFVTFKKLMVKRNVELELEAVHALQAQGVPIRHGNEDGNTSDGEEPDGHGKKEPASTTVASGEAKQDKVAAGAGRGNSALDRQLRKAMDANLQELELMHKREEVEQAELEQAIAMSLALEAKRIEYATAVPDGSGGNGGRGGGATRETAAPGCKGGDGDDADRAGVGNGGRAEGNGLSARRQSKEQEDAAGGARDAAAAADALAEGKCDFNGQGPRATMAEDKHGSSPSRRSGGQTKCDGSKALPPISKSRGAGEIVAPFRGGSGEGVDGCILSGGGTVVRDPDVESAERREEARAASRKARQLLDERRQAQKALKSAVSEEDSAERERHLKDMRDRIVSAKRAGREEQASKAASESASAAAAAAAAAAGGASGGRVAQARARGGGGTATRGENSSRRGDEKDAGDVDGGGDGGAPIIVSGEGVEEDFAEQQRRMMRVALAQHMKRELIESEQDRLAKVQAEQIADLNGKLRLVEKLRNENSEREAEIAAALRQQQRQR